MAPTKPPITGTRLADSTRRRSGLAVLYFLLVALTSISLSSKSPTLSIFTLQMLVLLRKDEIEPQLRTT